MWNAAAPERPAILSAHSRIAPPDEPGTPLRVSARIFAGDGVTPQGGAVVFGYQTDRTGVYGPRGARTWRLKGWARADSQGRFQFDTIRPAPYPNRGIAAHIHFYADGGGVPRQTLTTIMFEGDPLLTPKNRADSDALGRFRSIVPVRHAGLREECEVLFRVTGDFIF